VKNEDYWQDNGEPYLDTLVMPIITDAQAAIQALQAGEIDAVGNETASAVNVPEIVESSGGALYQYQDGFVPQVDSLQFNTEEGVLADPEVRKAIATAIDTDAIIDLAYFGLGSASKSGIASPVYADPAVDYTVDYAYDPDKAEEMLREAGVEEGTKLRLIYGPYRAGSEAAVQVIRENLADVGIEVELMPMEHAVLADTVYVQNDYDLFYFMFSQRAHPAVGVSVRYTCESITHTPFTNGSLICDPALDAAFAQGESGATPEEQEAGYSEAQVILNEQLPVYNIRDAYLPGIAASNVQGFDEWPDSFRMDKIWIEE
jgi:peptide/nickel transport system substrate-binding protein